MATSPRVTVMQAVKNRFEEADLATQSGLLGLKTRFRRNRYSSPDEQPCLAIAFVSDMPVDNGGDLTSGDELVRELALDLILDMQIETEASSEAAEQAGASIDSYDVTGLDHLSQVMDLALKSLRECCIDPLKETTDLGRKIDWAQDAGIDDDEDLPDDDGRLVARVNVIYRTSSWDPTLLLER